MSDKSVLATTLSPKKALVAQRSINPSGLKGTTGFFRRSIAGKQVIWGGCKTIDCSERYDEGAIFDPATNTWTSLVVAGAPALNRSGIIAVSDHQLVIREPGAAPAGSLGQYKMFNLATNQWSTYTIPIPSGIAPNRTFQISAKGAAGSSNFFWWGGTNGPVAFNSIRTDLADGYLFNNLTNSWSTISPLNAPSARFIDTNYVLGQRLILWSGSDQQFTYNSCTTGTTTTNYRFAMPNLRDGSILNLNTNTWIPIAADGAPTAGYYSTQNLGGGLLRFYAGYKPTTNFDCQSKTRINSPLTEEAILDVNSGVWVNLSGLPDQLEDYASFNISSTKVLMLRKIDPRIGGAFNFNDALVLNLNTLSASRVFAASPFGFTDSVSVFGSDQRFLMFVRSQLASATGPHFIIFDANENRWFSGVLQGDAHIPEDATMFSDGKRIYVMGGSGTVESSFDNYIVLE